jgi:hypothetical protein
MFTNTQAVTTHSAAPSKCIHSTEQKCDMDRTSTSRQNITSKYDATLLHTFICRHAHASPEAGATGPSQRANRCLICKKKTPTQTHTQLSQSAIHKRGPREIPCSGSLVSKQMQERHDRLAKATERGWMTEMSMMEMPCGRARRMSPRASGQMAKPSAEVPAQAARPGSRRRGGSRVEAMPARCTSR